MSDEIYRICSTPKYEKFELTHSFYLQKREGLIFKRWTTVASGFEHTDERGGISHRKFSSYEDAEKYFMQKYSGGNYVERIGNTYEVTHPRFYV